MAIKKDFQNWNIVKLGVGGTIPPKKTEVQSVHLGKGFLFKAKFSVSPKGIGLSVVGDFGLRIGSKNPIYQIY